MADQVLAVPDQLVQAAATFSQQAQALLALLSDLNTTATNLNGSLTTQAKPSFETLWLNWSVQLLGMANAVETMGLLLEKCAINYIETDSKISQAFKNDPAEDQKVKDEINAINMQTEQFQANYDFDYRGVGILQNQTNIDLQKAEAEAAQAERSAQNAQDKAQAEGTKSSGNAKLS